MTKPLLTTLQKTPHNEGVYIFREAASQTELEQLLRIRYQSFLRGEWRKMTRQNQHGIDLDAFDTRATHVGLFLLEKGIEKPIGYLRFVGEEESKQANWIKSILLKYRDLNIKKTSIRFPFQSRSKFNADGEAHFNAFLKSQQNANRKVIEVSRISILENYMSCSLGMMFINLAFAYAPVAQPDKTFFFMVKSGIEKVYANNGAVPMTGVSIAVLDQTFYPFVATKNTIEGKNKVLLFDMAAMYQQQNCIAYNKQTQELSQVASRNF